MLFSPSSAPQLAARMPIQEQNLIESFGGDYLDSIDRQTGFCHGYHGNCFAQIANLAATLRRGAATMEIAEGYFQATFPAA
jgi:hypothetical protein